MSISYDPTSSTPLGFAAGVVPSWGGQVMSDAEALWGRDTMVGLGSAGPGVTRIALEFRRPRFVGQPVGWSLIEATSVVPSWWHFRVRAEDEPCLADLRNERVPQAAQLAGSAVAPNFRGHTKAGGEVLGRKVDERSWEG